MDRFGRSAAVKTACQTVVDRLAAEDGLLPSVYLERGGRLRLHAAHGYWQAVDGLAPFAGVLGTTFATGVPHLEQDVSRDARYLYAADGVVAEACFPLRVGDRPVGVLNVEARRPLTDDELALTEQAAGRLERDLATLPPAVESPAQRLLRHAVVLAKLRDTEELEAAVVAAALDVGVLRSAALVRLAAGQQPTTTLARGPLRAVLADAPPQVLTAAATYAAGGSSVATTGRPGTPGPGFAELRRAGAEQIVVLSLPFEEGEPRRVLLLADDAPDRVPGHDEVEALELLAAHAAAALRTAADVEELREQAAQDSLTGLGHHATFHRTLQAVLEPAGSSRDTALLLIDVDGFKRYNDRHGHPAGDRVLQDVARCLAAGLRRDDRLFRIGGDELAAIVHVRTREEAEEVARRLHQCVVFGGAGVSVSIGAALAQDDEGGAALLVRADQALYAAKDAGRNRVVLAPVAA